MTSSPRTARAIGRMQLPGRAGSGQLAAAAASRDGRACGSSTCATRSSATRCPDPSGRSSGSSTGLRGPEGEALESILRGTSPTRDRSQNTMLLPFFLLVLAPALLRRPARHRGTAGAPTSASRPSSYPAIGPEAFEVRVEARGRSEVLLLRRHSVRAADARVRVYLPGGAWREEEPPPASTYRGSIVGAPRLGGPREPGSRRPHGGPGRCRREPLVHPTAARRAKRAGGGAPPDVPGDARALERPRVRSDR